MRLKCSICSARIESIILDKQKAYEDITKKLMDHLADVHKDYAQDCLKRIFLVQQIAQPSILFGIYANIDEQDGENDIMQKYLNEIIEDLDEQLLEALDLLEDDEDEEENGKGDLVEIQDGIKEEKSIENNDEKENLENKTKLVNPQISLDFK